MIFMFVFRFFEIRLWLTLSLLSNSLVFIRILRISLTIVVALISAFTFFSKCLRFYFFIAESCKHFILMLIMLSFRLFSF